ncbi:RsiV family protein [Psychrobacter sp. CAM01]|uniref:RsiV family protein n=1 Tax=Psychrobacter sp. CAM01 TaxID=3080335 RepID=UPI0029363204|nr:RsiV family protein [Psychrobacter sp. CAM01]MDV2860525.1 RsiV family protein [Psychrobacter sp. CAM01]
MGAASLSANAGSLISSTEYLDYQLPEKIQKICTERDNCPDIEVKYLKSNHSWIDNTVNARIDALVVNSKPSESGARVVKTPDDVKEALDEFVASQFAEVPADSVFVYSLMITPEYLGHVNDLELFEINSYVFTGGAHGMPYSEYLIFDQQTKKPIQLADMLQPNKKSRFNALAYSAYKEWVKTVDEDVANYEKSWPFTLSDNVTLTDQGIDIRYQHYSIGPYAYGMPVLSIPYSQLQGIIKPQFLPARLSNKYDS